MKANELRIGNLVTLQETIFKVIKIDGEDYSVIAKAINKDCPDNVVESLMPIPLTKEWLLKFGFEKKITSDVFPTFFKNKINVNDRVVYVSEYGFLNHIKNVHQLQNLYYALTGEELTII